MTIAYVATVTPFDTAATEDSAPLARIRYVNDKYTYVGVTHIKHDALSSVTGYGVDFWVTVDTLARQVHQHIMDLVATRKIHRVTTFHELAPDIADRINNSPELADLGPTDRAYVHLRVTDLLRFG